jgi:hypothetical protein
MRGGRRAKSIGRLSRAPERTKRIADNHPILGMTSLRNPSVGGMTIAPRRTDSKSASNRNGHWTRCPRINIRRGKEAGLPSFYKQLRAMKIEATPGEPVELDRNGPYSAPKCRRVNEIIWQTPSFATMRSSVRSRLAPPYFQSLRWTPNPESVPFCSNKNFRLAGEAASTLLHEKIARVPRKQKVNLLVPICFRSGLLEFHCRSKENSFSTLATGSLNVTMV